MTTQKLITSGSMLISNHLGKKTLLEIKDDQVTSNEENSLSDARAELNRQTHSPSIRSGNIEFLKQWLKIASASNIASASDVISTSYRKRWKRNNW